MGRTFRSLSSRNFRLYFAGQVVSVAGTFMQTVAQSWLVLKLTGSGGALGLVTTLQYLPLLVFGGLGGVIADRFDRRRLYLLTQTLAGLQALLLGVLTVTGGARLWIVYLLAFTLGLITAVDQPVRQVLLYDMVGPEDVANATSLNMAMMNISRVVGPAMAGVTIAILGIGPCFLVNAASFVAVIISLLVMRPSELQPMALQNRRRGQFRDGLRYVRAETELLALLIVGAIIFGLAWEFEVVLPLLARFTFHGGAGIYGLLTSAVGLGSVVGGLGAAARGRADDRLLTTCLIGFGLATLGAAAAPALWLEAMLLVFVGATGIGVASVASARLQLESSADMRGRVMALWTVAVIGTRPIGGPIAGLIAEHAGPRAALATGAAGVLLLALPVWILIHRTRRARPPVEYLVVPAEPAQPG
jgi:MFS family permease